MKKITTEEAFDFISHFMGKRVSRVWQGYGSSIFLEIGELTDNKGEQTIMIEGSWRVEKSSKISFGSWSVENDISQYLKELKNSTIRKISFYSRLHEIEVELDCGLWVCSFSTVEGDPGWALISPINTMLSSNGNLCFE